jgi:hypothetical protein
MLIFDLETNGLINDATTIHCLAIYDTDNDQVVAYNDAGTQEPVVRGIQRLEDSSTVAGHNVIGFDIPIIQKFYPWFNWPSIVCDTLLLSRLLNPNLLDIDQKRQWRYMPLQLYGRHSLEAYGHRLGEYKGGFSKDTDWKEWSQEMEDYCIQDVNVTTLPNYP